MNEPLSNDPAVNAEWAIALDAEAEAYLQALRAEYGKKRPPRFPEEVPLEEGYPEFNPNQPRATDGRFGSVAGAPAAAPIQPAQAQQPGAQPAQAQPGVAPAQPQQPGAVPAQTRPAAAPAQQPQTQSPNPVPWPAENVTPAPSGRVYEPDPEINEVSRVGVNVFEIPTDIPELPNLLEDERMAEQNFADLYEKDPGAMVKNYRDVVASGKFGANKKHVYNTDDAKTLSPDWNPQDVSPEENLVAKALYNTSVHQTANAIAKTAFLQHMDELAALPENDPRRSVLVTSGGVAAGKGFALKHSGTGLDRFGAVWDSAGEQNSSENQWVYNEAKKRGLNQTYVYVHANPENTWANPQRGVVERAKGEGRMVDALLFAESYVHGPTNFQKFAARVNHDPTVAIQYIDNTDKPTPVNAMPEAALHVDKNKLYDFAVQTLAAANAPNHIRKGAMNGQRIWRKWAERQQLLRRRSAPA